MLQKYYLVTLWIPFDDNMVTNHNDIDAKRLNEKIRAERRVYVTFTEGQLRMMDLAVELGMAINKNELIRMAIEKLKDEIIQFKEIQEYIENKKNYQSKY